MADQFSVTTSQGWFSRIGNSFSGALLGLLMFFGSFYLIWWNEGRAVDTARALAEAGGAVISVSSDAIDPAHDSQLIHITGQADTTDTVADTEFGIEAKALKLSRIVEMYQWEEKKESKTRNKFGGGTENVTTYTYTKKWADRVIDSDQFHEQGRSEHRNPKEKFIVRSQTSTAKKITVGAFVLSPPLVQQINVSEPLPVKSDDLATVGPTWLEKLTVVDGAFYFGKVPAQPALGDLRIRFQMVEPMPVSVIAQQHQSTFVAFQPKSSTKTIELLHVGTQSALEMIRAEEAANANLTWILRLVGYIVMSLGIVCVLNPLRVLTDVLPFLGKMVGFVLLAFSCVVASVFTLVTIAISWIAHRPMLAYSLLGLAAVGLVTMFVMAKRRSGSSR